MGYIQSMWLQRVKHDLETKLQQQKEKKKKTYMISLICGIKKGKYIIRKWTCGYSEQDIGEMIKGYKCSYLG